MSIFDDIKTGLNQAIEYEKGNLMKCWGVMAGFALIYILIGLIFLELIDKDKR